ncbi:MAG: glycosyltransferase family 4 protein [Candidatus Aenigmarchaeota archaeon]|nr:glycosyltransferase family 4 protein [Candidatus Aenigmarchaeota archaeon]
MRVARLCQYFYGMDSIESGLMPYFYNIVRELGKRGVENIVITPEADSGDVDGTQVRRIPAKGRLTLLRQGIDAYKNISGLKDAIDIIHTHMHGFFYLYHYKGRLGKPMVHTIHGTAFSYKYQPMRQSASRDTLYSYLFNRYACKSADAIVTVSSEERENVINSFGVDRYKVNYIPTAVDTARFRPLKMDKDIDVLYVGRFARKKAVPVLLKAAASVKKGKSLKICLVGGNKGDDDYNSIMGMIRKYGLSNVEIIAAVNHQKLAEYYNRAKVFVLPSYHEGMPKVLLEAMACGVPVVATNVCGNRDVVDERAGFLVKAGDPQNLAHKIKELLEDDGLRSRMGREGRRRVERRFTWDKIAEEHIKLYRSVCEQ